MQDSSNDPSGSAEIEQLRTLLYTDALTGVYNRRFFRHCIADQKSHCDKTAAGFTLLMIDVDRFKEINDHHGHSVGDRLIMAIANVFRQEFRELGWIFRYAGDDFVGLLRTTSESVVQDFCTHLLKKISRITAPNHSGTSVSIGYAAYPNDTRDIGDLLRAASRAMFASKRAGRNQFRSSSENTAATIPAPHFIGRQREIGLLDEHLLACRKGTGSFVVITGDNGIGKTRFVTNFLRSQRASDYHILSADVSAETAPLPYAPIREALKRGFEAKDPATVIIYKELEESRRRALIELVPQFDRFETEFHDVKQKNSDSFIAESVALLLQGLSKQLPVILFLEDANSWDTSTVRLIQLILQQLDQTRILIIATSADETTLPADHIIRLQRLSHQESNQLVEQIFHQRKISPDLQAWIYKNSRGNPQQIEDLLKLLITEGCIEIGPEEVSF
jgi:diguanylate cyclase (GGDEF)-like protein